MKSGNARQLTALAILLCIVLSACGGSSSGSSNNTPSQLSITTGTSLPSGQINVAYSTALGATGGTAPYAWTVTTGTLPTGLSLSTAGVISGTPTAAGIFNVTAQVSDSEPTPQRVTAQFGITIAPPPLSITTASLPNASLNMSYSADLAATGGIPPYTWSLTSGTLPAGLTLNPAGTIAGTPTATGTYNFTLQAADNESTPQTAPAQLSITVLTQVQVTTYRYDNFRTGQDLSETVLTPTSVASGQFQKLFSYAVDGDVYAQPLYLFNVNIPGSGAHNVIYVATEHDSVYALDADSNAAGNSAPLWQTSFLDPAHGITTIASGDVNCNGAIAPEIGITSTPVIDLNTNTIYVLAETKENGDFFHRLHALDITTGAEKFGGPVTISGSVSGSGLGSVMGTLTFDPLMHLNRPGLLLSGGSVIIAWSSNCDNSPFHGWVMAYGKTTLHQQGIWAATPNGNGGGIWMSGGGTTADASGHIFLATGNGTFDTTGTPSDFGDSIMRLTLSGSGITTADYFTPFDQGALDQADHDLGSGGVLLLPDQPGAHVHEAVEAGKEGSIYVVDRDSLGHYNPADNSQIVQNIIGEVGAVFSTPAYWNNNVYFGANHDALKAFSLTNGLLSAAPTSQSAFTFIYPGPAPNVSANGNANGIVWVLETDTQNNSAEVLRAYDATNLANELYNSNQNLARDIPGNIVKYAIPTIANGKVYVGAQQQVSIFGLGQSGSDKSLAPAKR